MTDAWAVVTLGETMGQLVPTDTPELISASHFALYSAGAESNVAIGLSRLGHRTAWVSRLGNDAMGDRVALSINTEKVDTSAVLRDDSRQTGLFVKHRVGDASHVNYYRRDSAAASMDRSDVERAFAMHPRVFHTSGVTAALSDSCNDAVEWAFEGAPSLGISSSFDVNYRPALWVSREAAADRLLQLTRLSSICFVGLDEAYALWATSDTESVHALIGPGPIVVVKDGARRATTFEGSARSVVKALRSDVVEVVGAGDAFAAGWLAGHLEQRDTSVKMRMGHLMARGSIRALSDVGTSVSRDDFDRDVTSPTLWSD